MTATTPHPLLLLARPESVRVTPASVRRAWVLGPGGRLVACELAGAVPAADGTAVLVYRPVGGDPDGEG